jgi:hypothetical protein
MITKLSNWLYKISTFWVMLLTLAVMILFMVTVLPAQAATASDESGSSESPDTSFFYSPRDLIQMAEDYGPEGRQAYIRTRWTFDLGFPLVYVSFLAVGISWLYQTLPGNHKILTLGNILPIFAGILDYLENSAASLVMGLFPKIVPGLPLLTAVLSGIKWLLVGGSFLLYFFLAGYSFYHWLRKRRAG